MPRPSSRYPGLAAGGALLALLTTPTAARALDKQGSAHGGSVEGAEGGFNVSGSLMAGVSLYNPSYAARPDNTGLAFLRYGARTELSLLDDLISVAVDTTFFTDRHASRLRPSELDLTPEIIGHLAPFEVHLAYERDMPLDDRGLTRKGLTQQFVYLMGVWSFDIKKAPTAPLLDRGQLISP